MRLIEILQEGTDEWTAFLVYGSFTDPATGKNAVIMRMPKGRVPWSKKIVPAINRLVKPWFDQNDLQRDRTAKSRGRERKCHWSVEGDPDGKLWDATVFSHYEWRNDALVPVSLAP